VVLPIAPLKVWATAVGAGITTGLVMVLVAHVAVVHPGVLILV
jgi:hypothetical protein